MVPSTYYCTLHFPHVTLQPSVFILWPLGPFDPFFTCNNFTVWFFKATGRIRLYWRNLVNTDSISRLVSYRDISRHCLWKTLFFFFLLDIEQLSKSIIFTRILLCFFLLLLSFLVIYSAGQIGSTNVQEGKTWYVKKFPTRKIFFLVISLCLYLLNTASFFSPP